MKKKIAIILVISSVIVFALTSFSIYIYANFKLMILGCIIASLLFMLGWGGIVNNIYPDVKIFERKRSLYIEPNWVNQRSR